MGAINPSGDLIVETRGVARAAVRAARAGAARRRIPACVQRIGNIVNQGVFPGMMGGGGGQLALNQLLVVMDGIDNPPFMRRFLTNRMNTFLDAIYVVPRRIGSVSAAPAAAAPAQRADLLHRRDATCRSSVLDPALTRPGRMGRHVWFRTPTKDDRKDIFDLYLDKVAHDPDLDTPRAPRRDRADHERLLAGDDRADLLDGADERAPRGRGSRSPGSTSSTR